MKFCLRGLLACALVAGIATAEAAPRKGRTQVALVGGARYWPNNSLELAYYDAGDRIVEHAPVHPVVEFDFQYQPTDWVNFGLGFGYTDQAFVTDAGEDTAARSFLIPVSVWFYFARNNTFEPFASLSLGWTFTDIKSHGGKTLDRGTTSGSDTLFYVGGGSRFPVNPLFGFHAETRFAYGMTPVSLNGAYANMGGITGLVGMYFNAGSNVRTAETAVEERY